MEVTARHELVPQLRFPPGFRFVPTEAELVDVYHRAKIEGHKLPLQVVNDVSILDWQPGKLVEEYKGYGENRWFFFTVREQSSSNKEEETSRKVRVQGVTATWKATGSVQLIRRRARSSSAKDNKAVVVVVGTKRVLIYNSSDPDENGKWSMHEYILKGHAAIGQYALYSIQRKQHSEAEDMDPEKKKKKTRKRKRTETPCNTEPEGLQQLPHPETTALLAEPPLKPTRRTKAQRKKKPASMQVGVEGEQQQKQGQSPMEPITPPKKDELAPRQQEGRQQPAAADGVPAPVVLSAVPDGTLGAPAPKPEENTVDAETLSQLWALHPSHSHTATLGNNHQGQEQWAAPSLTGTTTAFLAAPPYTNNVVDHAPLRPYQYQQQQEDGGYGLFGVQNQHLSSLGGNQQSAYMEQGWPQHADDLSFLLDNTTTQPMNSGGGWEHGGDQRYQVHQHLGSGENQSVYMEQWWQHGDPSFLLDNTTRQPMNSGGGAWEHGDDQRHHQILHHHQQEQQSNGGGYGVVEDQQQQPAMNHPLQGGHDPPSSDEQSSSSDDLLQVDDELDAFVRGVLVSLDEPPQDMAAGAAAGTQEQEQQGSGDGPPTLQLQAAGTTQEQAGADGGAATLQQSRRLQRDELHQQQQLALLKLSRALSEHVWDGPCSCMICAEGLWHYIFPSQDIYSNGSTFFVPNYKSF